MSTCIVKTRPPKSGTRGNAKSVLQGMIIHGVHDRMVSGPAKSRQLLVEDLVDGNGVNQVQKEHWMATYEPVVFTVDESYHVTGVSRIPKAVLSNKSPMNAYFYTRGSHARSRNCINADVSIMGARWGWHLAHGRNKVLVNYEFYANGAIALLGLPQVAERDGEKHEASWNARSTFTAWEQSQGIIFLAVQENSSWIHNVANDNAVSWEEMCTRRNRVRHENDRTEAHVASQTFEFESRPMPAKPHTRNNTSTPDGNVGVSARESYFEEPLGYQSTLPNQNSYGWYGFSIGLAGVSCYSGIFAAINPNPVATMIQVPTSSVVVNSNGFGGDYEAGFEVETISITVAGSSSNSNGVNSASLSPTVLSTIIQIASIQAQSTPDIPTSIVTFEGVEFEGPQPVATSNGKGNTIPAGSTLPVSVFRISEPMTDGWEPETHNPQPKTQNKRPETQGDGNHSTHTQHIAGTLTHGDGVVYLGPKILRALRRKQAAAGAALPND